MRRGLAVSAALFAVPVAAGTPIPARFVADRVIVDAPLADGGVLRFWSDTGGGGTVLLADVVARHGWRTGPPPPGSAAELGPGAATLAQPLPLRPGGLAVAPPAPIVIGSRSTPPGWAVDTDGNLGQSWWAGHVWTWDYPRGTLTLEAGWRPTRGARIVPVGFRAPLHFPRIDVTIAGETVPMLLDTGATTYLSAEASAMLPGPRMRATSMIVASRIAAWRRAHPDWRVIEHAQETTGSRMIEVPDVRIAGFQVGPLWFTERDDRNFREAMSSGTDRPVEGAIGGNAFHSLRMTVDYPDGRAAFVQPRPR